MTGHICDTVGLLAHLLDVFFFPAHLHQFLVRPSISNLPCASSHVVGLATGEEVGVTGVAVGECVGAGVGVGVGAGVAELT